jgi:hypothetical protein
VLVVDIAHGHSSLAVSVCVFFFVFDSTHLSRTSSLTVIFTPCTLARSRPLVI